MAKLTYDQQMAAYQRYVEKTVKEQREYERARDEQDHDQEEADQ
jgi:hypothetical protein